VEWEVLSLFKLHLKEYCESDKKNLKCFTTCYLFKNLLIMRPPNPCITCTNLVGTSKKPFGLQLQTKFFFFLRKRVAGRYLIKVLILWLLAIPGATYKYLVRSSHRTRRDKSDAKRTKWQWCVKEGICSQNSRRNINRTYEALCIAQTVHLNLKISSGLTEQRVNVVPMGT
jgi:hypothetical protein